MAEVEVDKGARQLVMVTAKDLPVYCPNPAMPIWSSHPRVFLEVVDVEEAMCPYCGTRYRFTGPAPEAHT